MLKDNHKAREDMDVGSTLDGRQTIQIAAGAVGLEKEPMPPAQAKKAAVNPYNTELGFLSCFL